MYVLFLNNMYEYILVYSIIFTVVMSTFFLQINYCSIIFFDAID
jgi:hypothetical protein